MKMMSRTRTTSTRGVMLISAREVWVRPLEAVKAITAAPPKVHGRRPADARQRSASPMKSRHRERTSNQAIRDPTLPPVLLKCSFKHSDQRTRAKLLRHGCYILKPLGLAERPQKPAALHPRPPQHAPFGQDDCPGNQAENEKDQQNYFGDWAGFTHKINNLAADCERQQIIQRHIVRRILS